MLLKKEAQRFIKLLKSNELDAENFLIGCGSSREAYRLNDNYIIKVPRFSVRFPNDCDKNNIELIQANGLRQCKKEIEVYKNCSKRLKYLLNPIVCYGEVCGIIYLIMPKVETPEKSVHDLNDFISKFTLYVPWSFKMDIRKLAEKHDLYYDDLVFNIGNFGLTMDNKICFVDYGTRS